MIERRIVVHFLPALCAILASGCTISDRVCNPDPGENSCGTDGDCVLAYCATECCYCPRPVARSAVESTWCLTPCGTTTPIGECLQGRAERCAGGPACVCPQCSRLETWCNAGTCDLRERTTP